MTPNSGIISPCHILHPPLVVALKDTHSRKTGVNYNILLTEPSKLVQTPACPGPKEVISMSEATPV